MFTYNPFSGEEHQAYELPGENGRAALLVHGFPGTPAELRPLGQALHQSGWTVRGLLLPGFGPEIASLGERKAAEWLTAVDANLAELQASASQVLLVGYSMGGALSLLAASQRKVDRLAILAPFWRTSGWFWSGLPLFKRLFPSIRPFRLFKMDLNDPQAQASLGKFLPGADLSDPQVQQSIREFEFPIGVLDELRQVGRMAFRSTAQIQAPTLVIQGSQDDWVKPAATRRLLQRLPASLRYLELPAAHDLVNPEKPAFQDIRQALLAFANPES
jgi:carboxylesterase